MKEMKYLTFIIMTIIGIIMMYITYSIGHTLYEGLVSKIGRPSFLFFVGACMFTTLVLDTVYVVLFREFLRLVKGED